MKRSGWVGHLLVSALAFSCGLQACLNNAEDCEQNGRCVRGTHNDVGGGGAALPAFCSAPDDCGLSTPCTTYQCNDGHCDHTTTTDGFVIDVDGCNEIVCRGGKEAPEPLALSTACGDHQVCDGAGQCVGCDGAHPCSDGDTCVEGACLNLGATCNAHGDCESGNCIDERCCFLDCGQCQTWTPDYMGCNNIGFKTQHATCDAEGWSCDGTGNCLQECGGNLPACPPDLTCKSGFCKPSPP